ncbi:MAG TPA: CAP-associated domain-containing protein, partial [Acetivibrio sp.]|nr:CAP-associated domain-containing protein [Acetivibrio sp.]
TINNTVYADLNGDGEVNSTDFTLLKRYLLRKIKEFPVNGIRPDAVRLDDLMGASVNTITNRFGQPDRIDLSRYGFDWYIYNNDLAKYLQIGIKDGKTVGIYSNSLYYKLNDNIGIGTPKSTVEEELGTPLSSITKGSTSYRMDNKDEWKVYKKNNEYYTYLFYNLQSDIEVTAFMMIDYATEQSLKGFYGTPSDRLRKSYEMELFDITNAYRIRHGKDPFKWSDEMAALSRAFCKDMVEKGYFDFTDTNGQVVSDRMRNAGINYNSVSELIAKGQMDSMFVIESWMKNRSSTLLGGHEYVGIGINMESDGCVVYVYDLYIPSKY